MVNIKPLTDHDTAAVNVLAQTVSKITSVVWLFTFITIFYYVFAQVYVYDLNVNKYRPICVQAVVSKKSKKLTRIDFNQRLPVLVCGDTK